MSQLQHCSPGAHYSHCPGGGQVLLRGRAGGRHRAEPRQARRGGGGCGVGGGGGAGAGSGGVGGNGPTAVELVVDLVLLKRVW